MNLPILYIRSTKSILSIHTYVYNFPKICQTLRKTPQHCCRFSGLGYNVNRPLFCRTNRFFNVFVSLKSKSTNVNSKILKTSPKDRKLILNSRQEIKKLFSLAKDEKWRLVGAIGLLLISSSVTLAVPFCMGKVIDIIYTSDAITMKANLTSVSQFLLVIFVFGALANFGRVYLMQTTGYRITQKLRHQVFSSIVKQEMAFFDKNKTGELINRLSADTSLVGNSLSVNISDGLRSVVSAIAGISMMFYMSTELALVGLATVPPVAGLAIVYGRYVRKLTTSIQDALAQTTQVAEERISNIRTVRAFAQERRETNTYKDKINGVLNLMYTESMAKGIFFGMTGLSGNIVVLSVLYYGGLMMTESQITVGDLSAFLLYAAYVGVSFGGLSSAFSETMKGLGASTRLWQIVDRIPTIPLTGDVVPSMTVSGNVDFHSLYFCYPMRANVPIFSDFSLRVPSGSVTALVGSSGSGKSTLAQLLLRFYDPDSDCASDVNVSVRFFHQDLGEPIGSGFFTGHISVDGLDIGTLSPEWIRTIIGTVNQEPVLFSCSIRENILYGVNNAEDVSENQLINVCKEANAYDFICGFPEKLETVVGERGLMLSGGQRQRIAIARALLKNPKILLLDEATSALDAESEYLVQEALERLMKGRTVITIAHRLSTIKRSDQIAVLHNGRIEELGNFEKLMAIPNGIFHKLVVRQTILPDK